MAFLWPWKLHELGVVGMNMRNVRYIAQNNPRHLYPLVDDKLQTKFLAQKAGLAVPKLIGVMRVQKHVKQLIPFMKGHESFVIKPAKGSGGKGILVITGRDTSPEYGPSGGFIAPDGSVISESDIHRHASNILSGLYSLGGNPDVAMIEEKIEFSQIFNSFTFQGVPDLRIIIYKGYPVLSMARLSTSNSGGKANLHQGAVGVGIDISTGRALHAIQHGIPITEHPDTKRQLSELCIPDWHECLRQAAMCFEVTGLGYLGADIVLDAHKGPMILELNARPGLAIQLANGQGLQKRLDAVDRHLAQITPKMSSHTSDKQPRSTESVADRVAFSVKHFVSATMAQNAN